MIYKYKMHDDYIVVDINSGSVFLFDELSYKLLDAFDDSGNLQNEALYQALCEKYTEIEVKEATSDIHYLNKENILFSEDAFKEHINEWDNNSVVKSICLHIAHDCNLRCKYCFAGEGDYSSEKNLMSFDISQKAIDFLLKNSGNRRNLEVDFFGGEPLLNFNVVKETVLYAREKEQKYNKNIRFTLTTNGVLLNDDNIEFINEHMSNIVLSLDGRENVHDRMRVRVDGSGSYQSIIPKIQKMIKKRNGKDYYVRGTFTGYNKDFSEDVLHIANLGIEQVSVEPVVTESKYDYALKEDDLEELFNEYEKLARIYLEKRKNEEWFSFFHFNIDLVDGPCAAKRFKGCGAGIEYLAVTPEGDLYPCHQFVGTEDFYLGNVFEGIKKKEKTNVFKESNIYTKEDCITCWAKFFCGGGCVANAYKFNKDVKIPYKIACELEKKRVECALWIKVKEEIENHV